MGASGAPQGCQPECRVSLFAPAARVPLRCAPRPDVGFCAPSSLVEAEGVRMFRTRAERIGQQVTATDATVAERLITAEFRPLQPVNRDAMAAFLYRMAGEPEVTLPENSPFTDVTPGQARPSR